MGYSFIIPVFNCAETLTDCVDSIRAVNLQDYEIILIDDGSTDGSGALCDALAARHPEIRALHQANSGVSAARNAGLRAATGERILFVDGDDALNGEALREVLECDADLLIFGRSDEPACSASEPEELFRANLLPPLWNKVYRRGIIQENHLRLREDMFIYEDLEFVLRYLGFCDSVRNVPRAAYHYRPSDKSRRRMMRLNSISEVLGPIQAALTPETEAILPQLAEILAREKLAVSNPAKIWNVIQDYKRWHPGGSLWKLLYGALRLKGKSE